jgi:threonine dehydrogenase-like Zn-dependent dehydrogenase
VKAVAVRPRSKEVGVIDVPEPKIESATQVKLRMLEIGVCGTDREICAFQYGTPPSGSDHLVLGHESLGEVIEVGPAVKGFKSGDLVVTMVRRPCPHESCLACGNGRQDFCYTGDFTERGIKMRHGFMTELVVDEEQYMNLVPASLRDVGVLVEPLTIAEKGIAEVWKVQERLPWEATKGSHAGHRHKAVVLGAGPVGLLGAMALVKRGFEVFVYSRGPIDDPRVALVGKLGATYVAAQSYSLERFAELVGNIDLVYEATGASQVSFELLKYLGANGAFILTGVPGRRGPIQLDTDLIMRNLVLKNQVLYGTVNASKRDFESAIKDLAEFKKRWPDQVKALITGRHAPERARDLLTHAPGGIKDVVSFARA